MAFINYEGDEIPTREPDFTHNGISYWFEELFLQDRHPWRQRLYLHMSSPMKYRSIKDMLNYIPPVDYHPVKAAYQDWKDDRLLDKMLLGSETFFERVIRRVKNIWRS